jgi:type III secretory pathway component EscV
MRVVEIPVKAGMVRQSLVTFNAAKRAPVLSIGEVLNITCPELGISFTTDLVISTARLRDRKNFTKIFAAYGATECDVIVLTEHKKNKWMLTIRKRPAGHAEKIAGIKRKKKSAYGLDTIHNETESKRKGHRHSHVDVSEHPKRKKRRR